MIKKILNFAMVIILLLFSTFAFITGVGYIFAYIYSISLIKGIIVGFIGLFIYVAIMAVIDIVGDDVD